MDGILPIHPRIHERGPTKTYARRRLCFSERPEPREGTDGPHQGGHLLLVREESSAVFPSLFRAGDEQ